MPANMCGLDVDVGESKPPPILRVYCSDCLNRCPMPQRQKKPHNLSWKKNTKKRKKTLSFPDAFWRRLNAPQVLSGRT